MIIPDLAGLAKALNEDPPVSWVLIGGFAVILHGGSNITSDVDISFATDPTNTDRLVDALRRLDARLSRGNASVDRQLIQAAPFLHLASSIGPLDLIPRPQGVTFDKLLENAKAFVVGGERVLVASLADLKLMKEAAARPNDFFHIAEILTIEEAEDQA